VLSVLSLAAGCHSSPGFSDATTEKAVSAAAEVNAPQLRTHIEALLKERQKEEPVASMFWGGMPLRRHNAASYIESYLTGLGLTPVHERETQNEIDTENIYVDFPAAASSERATELVLVTGHYDNWHLGADDNASAVAVLLETAQILRGKNLSRTVRIIAFDREEEGLIGSDRYAKRHAGDHLTAMINMDCVGYSSSKPGSQLAPPGLALRDVGDFLGILASAPGAGILSSVTKLSRALPSPVGVLGLIAPADGHDAAAAAFLRSDHAPFWRQGVPALFLTDTANFRNPNYHRSTDLPETLDYDFLLRNARLVVAATVALAEEG
jgi:hypothetical protein